MHYHEVKLVSSENRTYRRCHEDRETCPLNQATPEEIGWFYHSVNPNQEIANFSRWLLERRSQPPKMVWAPGVLEKLRYNAFCKDREAEIENELLTASLNEWVDRELSNPDSALSKCT